MYPMKTMMYIHSNPNKEIMSQIMIQIVIMKEGQ